MNKPLIILASLVTIALYWLYSLKIAVIFLIVAAGVQFTWVLAHIIRFQIGRHRTIKAEEAKPKPAPETEWLSQPKVEAPAPIAPSPAIVMPSERQASTYAPGEQITPQPTAGQNVPAKTKP
jgi:hypothetical protein